MDSAEELRTTDRLRRALVELPLIRRWREVRSERAFRRRFAACRGVYQSFDEARRSAPVDKPLGFDVEAMAEVFVDRVDRIFAYDYPVLFWLARLLEPGARVFDLGGNVGVHYYGYRRYLEYPPDLQWTVCEVAVHAAAGESLARERGARGLRFATGWDDADGATVLLASGALQYVEAPLARFLAGLREPPRHLFLNKLPLHERESFVTLQNSGPAYVPFYVFRRAPFLAELRALSYELVDAWETPERSCHIPFHPERSLSTMSGLYLRRTIAPLHTSPANPLAM